VPAPRPPPPPPRPPNPPPPPPPPRGPPSRPPFPLSPSSWAILGSRGPPGAPPPPRPSRGLRPPASPHVRRAQRGRLCRRRCPGGAHLSPPPPKKTTSLLSSTPLDTRSLSPSPPRRPRRPRTRSLDPRLHGEPLALLFPTPLLLPWSRRPWRPPGSAWTVLAWLRHARPSDGARLARRGWTGAAPPSPSRLAPPSAPTCPHDAAPGAPALGAAVVPPRLDVASPLPRAPAVRPRCPAQPACGPTMAS
jgi:hypothetical protein